MRKFDPQIHHRRTIRLRGFDYADVRAYFITACTRDRECWLSAINGENVELTEAGRIVDEIWQSLPGRFPTIATDAFVVMPNHVHGIVVVRAQFIAPEDAPSAANETFRENVASQGAMNRAPTDTGLRNYDEHALTLTLSQRERGCATTETCKGCGTTSA